MTIFVEPLEPMPEHGALRGYFYRQAGLYIAKHAHLLIALWDGSEKRSSEGGGTFETINFMRQKDGVVCHIPAPRRSNPMTVPQHRWYFPDNEMKRQVNRNFRQKANIS
jgi:hypothetical protein